MAHLSLCPKHPVLIWVEEYPSPSLCSHKFWEVHFIHFTEGKLRPSKGVGSQRLRVGLGPRRWALIPHLARAVENLCGVLQVHVAVGHSKVRLYVDCRKVAERPIGEAGSPPATGFIMLGRLAKARGPRSSSAAVSLGFILPGQSGTSGPPAPLTLSHI